MGMVIGNGKDYGWLDGDVNGPVEARVFQILRPDGVDLLMVCRVTEVDFVGGDANNGAYVPVWSDACTRLVYGTTYRISHEARQSRA